jgi:endonuclease/exonuclease/phosphatase family metal-dependent hydrolase
VSLEWDPGFGPLLATRVRVVTWNLWGRYGPWAERQPAILENLRMIDADIVCLQEAWHDGADSQPDTLAAALGLTAIYAPAFEMNGAWSGNVVLTRWPVTRHEIVELPMSGGGATDTDPGERRLALFVEVDGPRGPLQVFCTHLSWRADWSGVRQAQVARLCELIRSTRPRQFPPIVCGDLNAVPASDEIRMLTGLGSVPVPGVVLRDAWEEAGGPHDGSTISHRNPYAAATLDRDVRIDYILVGWPKSAGAGHILGASVAGDQPVGGLYGSDHFAVMADLRY